MVYWADDANSASVTAYAEKIAGTFTLDSGGQILLHRRMRQQQMDAWKLDCGIWLAGLAIGWIVVATTGWVVRGFRGIPRGEDEYFCAESVSFYVRPLR